MLDHKTFDRFFVVDGIDGSGKATQTKLLVEKLTKEKFKVKLVSFPQYGEKSAVLVEEFLNGGFGEMSEVTPFQASIFYAADRFAASKWMIPFLEDGGIIISDRYTSSSKIHQTARVKNKTELDKFLEWIEYLEYGVLNIPKPKKVYFLNVPPKISYNLIEQKNPRLYITGEGNRDIAESDQHHQSESHKMALGLVDRYDYWEKVDCINSAGELKPVEEINTDLFARVKKMLK